MAEQIKDTVEIKDGRLLINVALGEGYPSASGKTQVYWTSGSPPLDINGYKLNATLYRK